MARSSSRTTAPLPAAAADPAAIDAQAAAFARLLGITDNADDAFRQAAALGAGLFPHQIEGVAFLLGRRRAILADDMGLGKTRQAIVAMRHAAPSGPYLVVCPASVKRNWVREIRMVAPDARVAIVDGGARVPGSGWVVVNYDLLGRHRDALAGVPWVGLIFDEAHRLKNHTSRRSRLAREIVAHAAARGADPLVYLLTGTPLTNRPRDLFVLLQLVGHPLGRSFLAFAKRYCAAERNDHGSRTDGASRLDELALQLRGVMLRRSKGDVLALPPKLRAWVPVDVPAGTASRDVRRLLSLLLRRQADTGVTPAQDARVRGRVLALLTTARRKLAIAKTPATLDLVSGVVEGGEKVIVFSGFDEPLQRLSRRLGSAAVLLTGRTPAARRQELVDRFQHDDSVRVFLANIVAGGTGITLTAATQVVFNDLDCVPANHTQAEERAYRPGQVRTVNATYLVAAGTLDEFVAAVLGTKRALVGSAVDGQAFAGPPEGTLLEDLERALRALSPGLTDSTRDIDVDAVIEGLLGRAAALAREAGSGDAPAVPHAGPAELAALRGALDTLKRALAERTSRRYRVASSSQPGVTYEVVVSGGDVGCSCPVFEYRGFCRHARDVQRAAARGGDPGAGYEEVAA